MPYRCRVSFATSRSAPYGLVGREAETLTIDDLVGGLTQRGAAILVSGDVGIGKSALIEYAKRHGGS